VKRDEGFRLLNRISQEFHTKIPTDKINKNGHRDSSECYPLVNIQKNYGKSPFLMGKSTISMAAFNSKLFVYQRVGLFWNPMASDGNMAISNLGGHRGDLTARCLLLYVRKQLLKWETFTGSKMVHNYPLGN
jgi:hypothetical protein